MKHSTPKATRHVNQNEGLIFEKSSAGKAAWKLPPLDVPEVDPAKLLGKAERKDLGNMPEVSEIEIIRHFTRLSTWNYAIDLGMYPLGSCTMKYNPRVNEAVARVEGIANGHPYQPEKISQGALQIMKTLSECLIEITGMDAITLQPAAGAHGEMTGLLMVRAQTFARHAWRDPRLAARVAEVRELLHRRWPLDGRRVQIDEHLLADLPQ